MTPSYITIGNAGANTPRREYRPDASFQRNLVAGDGLAETLFLAAPGAALAYYVHSIVITPTIVTTTVAGASLFFHWTNATSTANLLALFNIGLTVPNPPQAMIVQPQIILPLNQPIFSLMSAAITAGSISALVHYSIVTP